MPDTTPAHDFSTTWARASSFPGWLTDDQARTLWEHARPGARRRPGRRDRQPPGRSRPPCWPPPLRGRSVRLTADRPAREGLRAGPRGRPPRLRGQPRLARSARRGRAGRGAQPRAAARPGTAGSTCSTSTAPTTTAASCATSRGCAGCGTAGSVLVHDAFSSVGVTLAFLTHVVRRQPAALPHPRAVDGGVPARAAARRRPGRDAGPAAVVRAQRPDQGGDGVAPARRSPGGSATTRAPTSRTDRDENARDVDRSGTGRGPAAGPSDVLILNWRDEAHPEGGGSEVYIERIGELLVARGPTRSRSSARTTPTPRARRCSRPACACCAAGAGSRCYPCALAALALGRLGRRRPSRRRRGRAERRAVLGPARLAPTRWSCCATTCTASSGRSSSGRWWRGWAGGWSRSRRRGSTGDGRTSPSPRSAAASWRSSASTAGGSRWCTTASTRARDAGPARHPDATGTAAPPCWCSAGWCRTSGSRSRVDTLLALRARHPGLRLVVAGHGYWHDALARHVADAGLADHVELAGYVPPERRARLLRDSARAAGALAQGGVGADGDGGGGPRHARGRVRRRRRRGRVGRRRRHGAARRRPAGVRRARRPAAHRPRAARPAGRGGAVAVASTSAGTRRRQRFGRVLDAVAQGRVPDEDDLRQAPDASEQVVSGRAVQDAAGAPSPAPAVTATHRPGRDDVRSSLTTGRGPRAGRRTRREDGSGGSAVAVDDQRLVDRVGGRAADLHQAEDGHDGEREPCQSGNQNVHRTLPEAHG